jgi:hypothetical protein
MVQGGVRGMALHTPSRTHRAQELIQEMHGGLEQLEQRWRLGSTYGNRYGAKDNGFSQGGRAILDMDPCQCPTTPVFGMISRRGIR